MTDEIYTEYRDAVSKLYKFCKRIRWENKFLRQSLDAINLRYKVGSGDDLPDEAVPFLANGESFTLTKFGRWAYEIRWELEGYYDKDAWTPEYYATDEARELASLCEEMVICINSIENVARGDWNNLFKSCWALFDDMDKVSTIYTRVIGESDEITYSRKPEGDELTEPLVVHGDIKVTNISAWNKSDGESVVTQIGFYVYENHDDEVGIGITDSELSEWRHSVSGNKFKVTIDPIATE